MKVIDLHPEDLVDKEARGELTESERARLDAHLERCTTCRVERDARSDFAAELEQVEPISVQDLLALVQAPRVPTTGAPEKDAAHAGSDAGDLEPRPKTLSSRPSRSRRATRVGLLVAAAVLAGGAAAAGGGVRVLARLSSVWSDVPDVEVAPRSPHAATGTPAALTAHARVTAPPRASDEVAPPAGPEPTAPVRVETAELGAPVPVAPRAPTVTSPTVAAPRASASALVASAAAMFDAANEARRQGDYARAIELHRRLELTYPSSREAHVSQATVGRLLLDRGDPASALAIFDAYRARGAGPLDESVLIGRATALEKLGRSDDARRAWRTLLASFPDTPYAEHARARAGGDDGLRGR